MWLPLALLLALEPAAALPIQRPRVALVESARASAAALDAPRAGPAARAADAGPKAVVALQTTDGTLTSKTRAAMSRVDQHVVQPVQDNLQGYSAAQIFFSQIILLALLGFVWSFLCMGKQRSTLLVSRDDLSGDFKPIGLCSCISFKMLHVAEALCCSLFMWAETAAKLGVGSFGYLLAGVIFLQVLDNALIMVGGPAHYLGYVGGLAYVVVRLVVRSLYLRRDLKQATSSQVSDGCYDCLAHVCCTPCAISQEAEFIEHYEKHYPLQAAV